MARKDSTLRTCMIVQQLDDKYYIGWTDADLTAVKQARNGDISGIMNVIGQRLYANKIGCAEMHGIIHDDDWRSDVWSETEHTYITEKKPSHFHIVLKFTDGSPSTLDSIAKACGFEPQAIEKAKKGKYSYDNMLAYLIHAKYSDKTQYDPHKVVTVGCFKDNKPMYTNYIDIYNDRKAEWAKGKASVNVQKAKTDIDMLEEMILTGQITKSQVILTDNLYNIYSRNCRRCEDAFMIYGERRAYKTLQALQNGDFKLSVFFITGLAGSGKTRMAKAFVDTLIKQSSNYDETWRVCQTAASNPMDDYNGEEILFMDDIRGSAMSASDWLKLLDPYHSSPASARYHNKMPACRVIVITSTKEPIEFFYYCKQMGGGDRSEALDQFMRRIQCLTRVIKAEDFTDTKAVVSPGVACDSYTALIPTGNECHKYDRVNLCYKFEGEDELSCDDAVNKLVDITMLNNFSQSSSKLETAIKDISKRSDSNEQS